MLRGDWMVRFISRLFNIRTREWPRLLILYSMAFLFIVGITWGELTVQAAFLFQVGIKSLPQVLVANAVVSLVAIAIYTPFVDRVANDRLLIAISMIGAFAIGIGDVLLGLSQLIAAYAILYLLSLIVRLTFNLQWWTYVNSFYDTRAAKRIIPVLTTASRIAVIVAGLTLPYLNAVLSPFEIVVLWIGSLLAVALIAWLMPYLLREARQPPLGVAGPDSQRASLMLNVREGYRFVSQSPYLRWMALATLVMTLLFALLNYYTSHIFTRPENFSTSQELSSFLGQLSSAVSLILLPVQLLLLSRFVGWMGLGNANLIFPVGTLAICAALLAWPQLGPASLGYLDIGIFRTTFRNPMDNLLYNAIPLRIKGRSRAFIGGFVDPLGSLIGGGLLLSLRFVTVEWFLPALIGVSAMVYVISVFAIRKHYGPALVTMLDQEGLASLLAPTSDQTADATTLNWLKGKLDASTSDDYKIFVAKLITEVGGSKTIPLLVQIAESGDAHIRSAVVDILTSAEMRGDSVRQLYMRFLADPDGLVRRSAIAGLEQCAGQESKQFLAAAFELLQDQDVNVVAQVIPPLIRSGDLFYLIGAAQPLGQLLADCDPNRQICGIRALGQVGDARFICKLVDHLTDQDDQVRLEAATAIAALAKDKIPDPMIGLVLERLGPLLNDPMEQVRRAAVAILGSIHKPESYQALLRLLIDPSLQVKEAAVDALVRIGSPVIPTALPGLDSADQQARKMTTVVLSQIDREQFGPRVESHINDNLCAIYRNYGWLEALSVCVQYASLLVLQKTLYEQNRQLVEEIFYLLAAIHSPKAVTTIAESMRSETARIRANAAEALESLTTQQTARLIAPLFDPEVRLTKLLRIGQDQWSLQHPDTATAIRHLVTTPDEPWLRAIMTFALGEMAAFDPKQKTLPWFTRPEIESMLKVSLNDPVADVRAAASAALRIMSDSRVTDVGREENKMLSTVEKIIFLKEVPFFQSMTVDQLKVLAGICEEELFAGDTQIFDQGTPGGTLYVVVSGRVAIEREGLRKGSVARLATVEPRAYFGEMSLFDGAPHSAAARAIQDTLTLRVRREPLIALVRQHPDLALELVRVLNQRLRDANDRIAELTRSKPRELQKLYDKLD